jgi:predicted adenine nucleotide alpha hydrolase (AANH) superfamily ATPase
MKNKWEKYSSMPRMQSKGYLRKMAICRRKELIETGYCNCLFCRQKKQKEIEENNESIREKCIGEAHQEGRQGIQGADQGRCAVEEVVESNAKKEVVEQFYFSEDLKPKKEEKMAKETKKEKKHEAKESKAYEKKEDRKEKKK